MKKKALKKMAVSVISAVAAVSLIAGCSSSDSSSSQPAQSAAEAGTTTPATAKKDPVTIKVEVFDRGNSPAGMTVTKNEQTKFVKENFTAKTNINVEYVPVPRSQEVEKLNILMASGDAPDIVFTYDMNTVYKYVQQGGLTELGEIIDKYGPDLKAFLGKETLDTGIFDKGQYAIPAKRVYLGKYSSMIRQDWLDKLSLPLPKTTDDVYNVLKAFKDKDPGGLGAKNIPLGFTLTPASYEPIIWSFLKPGTEEQQYTLTQQVSHENMLLMPGHKDAVQFLNKLFNEGLMSPDFALDKDRKKLDQDITNGMVGMYSEDAGNSYYNDGAIDVLAKNVASAKLVPVDPYTNEEGKHAKPAYAPTGIYIIVPKTSKHAAEAVQYLNWMAQKDPMFTLRFGVEGQNFTMVDGFPQLKDDEVTKNRLYNAGDMIMISNGTDFGSLDKNLAGMALTYSKAYRDESKVALMNGMQDGIKPVRFDHPLASEAKYGKSLADKYDELLVKAIMAKIGDFNKVYEDAVKDYMASGGQEVLKERQEAYQAMKK